MRSLSIVRVPFLMLAALALVLSVMVVPPAVAAPPAPDSSLTATQCVPDAALAAPLDPTETTLDLATCGPTLCTSDAECQTACPQDPGTYCFYNQCVYPGIDSGGVCPYLCVYDSQCEVFCPGLDTFCGRDASCTVI